MSKPVVAIVGRPNVGKSTLFNRIVGKRIAIVEDKPGITRDRLYQDTDWNGKEFTVIDTGGIDFDEADSITAKIRAQVNMAIRECDLILFLVDSKQGTVPADEETAAILRKAQKPVILVANKTDNFNNNTQFMEFFQLGLGEPLPISAVQGLNIGELLDAVTSALPEPVDAKTGNEAVRIAVIGRPNVGKSSLVNNILGEERVIVSDIPGTTRDAIDSPFFIEDNSYILIDTAGIRRKSRIDRSTEWYSVNRSFKAVERCDVALMLIDSVEGVTDQDKRIAGYAHDRGKATIIVVNKWDLVDKDEKTASRFMEHIRYNLSFLSYTPIIFVSALTGRGMHKVLSLVNYVAEQANMRISTASLNQLMEDAILHNPPPAKKGKRLKIFYATQAGVNPPTFLIFANDPDLVHFSYMRYVENRLRETYGFEGTPLRIVFRRRNTSN
ncbi:MAG: ribosome biogenesis GTPase Der [Firmicutes bacterium]|nr:ribosome biogenesis GTPase Der [Bacillota bacterium]